MLRTAFLSLFLLVSLSSSSTSILRKSISRRQSDPQYCQAIEGFDCKCTYYRVTCTADRDLPSPLNVLPNEKNKYQSVELVVSAQREITVDDQTFAPVKELFKQDGDNFEFRLKFEKFTALTLSSPKILNRVFPDNLPSTARKSLALEIYSRDVPPHNNPNLFQNLDVDTLELYALYPFHGTFQELFNGANIKFLRLSGGDIRSDLSQPFSGNIGSLELAKQASSLSVQNFPLYPAHELIINAFFITDFNSQYPPNYANLAELRVYSPERIPANAFQQFPNIKALELKSDKGIDPQALNGLQSLEKLSIKDTKPSVELLNSAPNVKEFETNIEKLDEKTQCQFLEKLANGQVSVQAIPNGRDCTCVAAYLDSAAGRAPCEAQNCEQSSCAAIKNSYDSGSRTFRAPPQIRRPDGSDALRPREPRVYSAPFSVSDEDKRKVQQATPYQPSGQQEQQPDDDSRRPEQPAGGDQGQWNPDQQDDQPSWYTTPSTGDSGGSREEDNTGYNPNYGQDSGGSREYPPYEVTLGVHDYKNDNSYRDGYRQDPPAENPPIGEDSPNDNSDRDDYRQDPPREDPPVVEINPNDNSGWPDYRQDLPIETTPVMENKPNDNSDWSDYRQDPPDENPPIVENEPNDNSNLPDYRQDPFIETTTVVEINPNDNSGWPDYRQDPPIENPPVVENVPNEYPQWNYQNEYDTLTTTAAINDGWNNENAEGETYDTVTSGSSFDGQQGQEGQDGDTTTPVEGGDNRPEGEGVDNRPVGEDGQPIPSDDSNVNVDGAAGNGTETATPPKKGMSWLPIIIIAASIAGLLLLGLIILLVRKRRTNKGYTPTAGAEPGAAGARA